MTVGSAIALAVERGVAPVEGIHRTIAGRWFDALAPLSRPVQISHDAVARVVYGSIRLGANAVGAGIDAGIVVESQTADSVRALVNGFWGDALGRHEPALATSMSLRNRQGAPVPVGELATAFPAATGQTVVLVHGLMKTERCWHGTDAKRGMLQSLEEDSALTPVAIRYNTGLEVAGNGERLASLLEEVHAAWPVPVESIALVGHSMGGLVVHRACTAARSAGHRWLDDVHDVVTIGSPHRGAPLEKLAAAAARALGVLPQTRPLAEFLDTRSRGIKDLGGGVTGDAAGTEIRHHFVAGVVTSDPTHPLAAVVGDLMVRPASGTGAPRLVPTNAAVLGGVHHFNLLHDADVIDTVTNWLRPAP